MSIKDPETILEVLWLATKVAGFGAHLYEQVQGGSLTEEEAITKWKRNATKVAQEGVRFDELTK